MPISDLRVEHQYRASEYLWTFHLGFLFQTLTLACPATTKELVVGVHGIGLKALRALFIAAVPRQKTGDSDSADQILDRAARLAFPWELSFLKDPNFPVHYPQK